MNIVTTLSTPDMKRLATAVGAELGLVDNNDEPRDANPAEIKKLIGFFVKELVAKIEGNKAAKNARDNVGEIDPT